MRMRIAGAVLALVGCQSKSERPAEDRPAPGMTAGSGSAAPTTVPEKPRVQSVTGQPPADKPKEEPAPATPTQVRSENEMRPAGAPVGDRPAEQRLPAGTIGFGKIEALDRASLDAIDAGQKIKTEYQTGLRRCYLVHLTNHPAAKGTAKLTFTVGTDGKVTVPSAKSFAAELDACLASAAASWGFTPPTARVRFVVELVFNPG